LFFEKVLDFCKVYLKSGRMFKYEERKKEEKEEEEKIQSDAVFIDSTRQCDVS